MHERFGLALVADVLKGSNSAKIRSLNFNNLSTYGIMKDYSKDTIKDLISFLITENYIASVGDKYPTLRLTNSANDILFKNKPVFIKRKIEKIPEKKIDITKPNNKSYQDYDTKLFEILRNLRMEISKELRMPPFIIFTDVSLKQMSTFYPTTVEEFLNIDGVGNFKLEQYGDRFLETISKYVIENKISKD